MNTKTKTISNGDGTYSWEKAVEETLDERSDLLDRLADS